MKCTGKSCFQTSIPEGVDGMGVPFKKNVLLENALNVQIHTEELCWSTATPWSEAGVEVNYTKIFYLAIK